MQFNKITFEEGENTRFNFPITYTPKEAFHRLEAWKNSLSVIQFEARTRLNVRYEDTDVTYYMIHRVNRYYESKIWGSIRRKDNQIILVSGEIEGSTGKIHLQGIVSALFIIMFALITGSFGLVIFGFVFIIGGVAWSSMRLQNSKNLLVRQFYERLANM